MERRITITKEQHRKLYKNKPKHNDYFVAIASDCQIILFDTLEEAEKFNNSIKSTFDTALNMKRSKKRKYRNIEEKVNE